MRNFIAALALILVSAEALSQTQSGGIVAFTKEEAVGAYVFESRGPQLYARFITGWSSPWEWEHHGTPPRREGGLVGPMSPPAVISYSAVVKIGQSSERLEAFVIQNGRLYSRYWDGAQWDWTDLGAPSGETLRNIEAPAVITYMQPDWSTRRTHVFVTGTNGDLYELTRTGTQSQWTSHGHPPKECCPDALLLAAGAGVVSYVEGNTRRILVFVRTSSLEVWVRFSNGGGYQWAFQDGYDVFSRPSAVTYSQGGVQRIYAFVKEWNLEPELTVNYWNGYSWQWANQNTPYRRMTSSPHAITLNDDGVRKIFVFTVGNEIDLNGEGDPNGRLWSNVWDGFQWTWTKHVSGPEDIHDVLGAVTYKADDSRRYVVIVRAANGDVWQDRYANGVWTWSNLGQP